MASIMFKVWRICNSQLKFNYLKKEKLFLNFLFHFWNLHQILNILKEKMIVIANVFPKLQTVKIFVRKLSQEHRFRTGFCSQHVKASQLLSKSPWERIYYVLFPFSRKLIWNMSHLVWSEISKIFINTLTADGKYPAQGCENFQYAIEMQLSEKQKTFSDFCVWFLDSTSNFEHFERKDDCHS